MLDAWYASIQHVLFGTERENIMLSGFPPLEDLVPLESMIGRECRIKEFLHLYKRRRVIYVPETDNYVLYNQKYGWLQTYRLFGTLTKIINRTIVRHEKNLYDLFFEAPRAGLYGPDEGRLYDHDCDILATTEKTCKWKSVTTEDFIILPDVHTIHMQNGHYSLRLKQYRNRPKLGFFDAPYTHQQLEMELLDPSGQPCMLYNIAYPRGIVTILNRQPNLHILFTLFNAFIWPVHFDIFRPRTCAGNLTIFNS